MSKLKLTSFLAEYKDMKQIEMIELKYAQNKGKQTLRKRG
jgi:hypothetical protein|tara:strand:+ start:441 stop:560 length:120 start_codon:yes stop_codon:yes gene_type:complete